MNDRALLPTIDALKDQARRLRATLEASGIPTSHSKSLELLAHQHGFKDWNTLHAALDNRPPERALMIGERVTGHYLGQYFEGEVIGVQCLVPAHKYRVTFVFDEAVDVVTFAGMSNFRKRVTCVIGSDGATVEKTSNGRPQLSLNT